MKNKIKAGKILLVVSLFIVLAVITDISTPFVSANFNATVCCQKTISGLYCQNVPASQCASGSTQTPTACESTSFCNPGVCYNPGQGTCLDNTPAVVCNSNNGSWFANSPPQCNLGCCVLGDQAAFVTLSRCQYLSSKYGLQTNYNGGITDEVQCVNSVQNQQKGACVYTDNNYQKTCTFTTRGSCSSGNGLNSTNPNSQFFVGKLCTDPELNTTCTRTQNTMCDPGKDEVYFKDSCGNQANIYDSSKINDVQYWTNVIDKSNSCNSNSANANSASCGNCNYLLGSICRSAGKTNLPLYGNNVCSDLNCHSTSNGQSYKHGESWCVYNDAGKQDSGDNSVGSGYFLHICESGQEVLQPCANFRQQICLQDSIQTSAGPFSQASCVVNRWQDCISQGNQRDCENTDQRDCLWKAGAALANATSGACVPKYTPGLQFWQGADAQNVCSQANAACVVTFKKGLFGGETCKENCNCLTSDWVKQHTDVCTSLGDCGPKTNWQGTSGYNAGYNLTTSSA